MKKSRKNPTQTAEDRERAREVEHRVLVRLIEEDGGEMVPEAVLRAEWKAIKAWAKRTGYA